MGVPDALRFVTAVRADPALASRLDALGDEATLEQVAEIAVAHGFVVTAGDLRAAHRHDWGMRWTWFRPQ